jgi:uncharacterized membrane protein YobD (UPF0266 family)
MKNHKNTKIQKTLTGKETPEGEPIVPSHVIFEWNAPEYIQHNKSKNWYFVAGAIVIALVLVSIFTGNWTMALAIVTLAGVYIYLQTHHPPKNIKIQITEMGIYVGHMFFSYSNIEAFWIIVQDGLRTLNLRIAKRRHTDIIIQLNSQDPVPLRQYLVGQIPEWEGKHESFTDTILRLLKL